ncbi:helix-turn-helix domain-containing protein [Maribacter sp. M208]|uniref:winged helix-turn-helix transcriptional regulator n=1 Tax=Maribacter huludaoensis TaxID=3030010 RepID=UPI0023EAC2F3|nr:helix-turn-helix domain-containing protein [Maribacter huludaoensis]MDF4221959.1 helix-turn-helix domain-containing protein [Maribacter huludaoensis]
MAKHKKETQALDYSMEMIGGKWKPIILYHVNKGTNRFNKLFTEIEGINRQMLSKQLKSLERSGILDRTLYGEIPPRVEYTLTALGKSLLPIVEVMTSWGQKQITDAIVISEVVEVEKIPEIKEMPKAQQILEVKKDAKIKKEPEVEEAPKVPQNHQLPLF